jgi:mono/diheme cytochrome c family protein
VLLVVAALNVTRIGPQVRAAPSTAPTTAPAARPQDEAMLARGLTLYAASCAACHGEQGLGDGSAAYLLYPKPRNFAEGQFRITSTKSGLPSDEDLMQVLRRGMPGSAMPSWGHLPEQDLRALVVAVRELAVRGKAAQLMSNNKSMKPDRALKVAHSMLDPGAVEPLPAQLPEDQIDLKRGEALYAMNCAACHDSDGRGRNKRDLTDNTGQLVFARDFTAGVFKGGSEPESLARRITRGMPGSPMPAAAEMPAADLWSLVAHVQQMIRPGAQERVEQVQRALAAVAAPQALTTDPDDEVWRQARETFVPLMPLAWRDERSEGVTIRALHDDKHLAIRIEWKDSTQDDAAVRSQDFTDGVAVQLSADENPPLFAMGQKDALVNIWYWKAVRQRDLTDKSASLEQQYPNMPRDDWGEPKDGVYHPSSAAGNVVAPSKDGSSVECLIAGGFGTLTSRGPTAQVARGGARRTADGWAVVFLHPLGAESHDDAVVLEPGRTLSIAFAVWDGAAGDRNGQKSVTIWHKISIEK